MVVSLFFSDTLPQWRLFFSSLTLCPGVAVKAFCAAFPESFWCSFDGKAFPLGCLSLRRVLPGIFF